jgi:hypothetical protein
VADNSPEPGPLSPLSRKGQWAMGKPPSCTTEGDFPGAWLPHCYLDRQITPHNQPQHKLPPRADSPDQPRHEFLRAWKLAIPLATRNSP